jgi:2-polyprenyl-3-methyl-5-hydroxy-6-metoxy-1,4-benzoquinol methylase
MVTSPRPIDSDLSKYYHSEQYISHSNTSKGIVNKLYHLVRKFTLKKKLSIIKSNQNSINLLDIGSGAGHFLNFCKLNKVQSIGIEPDDTTRNTSANQFNIEVYNESKLNEFKDSNFTVITLWHVLEHVSQLSKRLLQIHRILSQDGILVIAVPNCSSFDAKYYNNFWAGYDVPRHLFHFTPKTMNHLIKNHGFFIESVIPMYFDAMYVSILSERYKKSWISIPKGLCIGIISNIIAFLKNNNSYSSQIYILKKVK